MDGRVYGGYTMLTRLLFNAGTITLAGAYNYIGFFQLINTDLIEIDASTTLDGSDLENNGMWLDINRTR